jgi:hypothetical protein
VRDVHSDARVVAAAPKVYEASRTLHHRKADSMESTLALITASAPRALFVIVFVVGIIMALTRRARHPNASRLAVIAFVLLIAGEAVQVGSQAYLMSHAGRIGPEFIRVVTMLHLGNLAVSILGMLLLVLAVFADRDPVATSAGPATTSALR